MLLIPAIDLRGGRCVRLHQGDFATETAYDITPGALARRYQALGARWLHIVDLDGAKDGVPVNAPIVESLARERVIRLQVGGGIRTAAAVETLLSAGVARVVIGSAAVERPTDVARWVSSFGRERICLAFDVHISHVHQPQVHTRGWVVNGALSLWEAINIFPPGLIKHVLSTDIGRDGTLLGPNLRLYRLGLRYFPELAWQASGGIRDGADLKALADIGVAVAVSGTALLKERIGLKELRPFLPDASSPVSTCATA